MAPHFAKQTQFWRYGQPRSSSTRMAAARARACVNLSGHNQDKKQRPEIYVEGKGISLIAEPGGQDWRAAREDAAARLRG
jgi:hypothetical protein